jgi:putative oxidoreductase
LLLMRLVVGSALIVRSGLVLRGDAPLQATINAIFLVGLGVLLIPGLWTPVVGTFAALAQLWQILAPTRDPWVSILIATICAALAMLGPGLWSIDARLFGWKRVEAPSRKSSSNSH